MIELIAKFRKEIEEDKKQLLKFDAPEDIKKLAKEGHERIEQIVEVTELQNEILHVMGTVIVNCSNIIDTNPEAVKEILLDAVERIKKIKSIIGE